MYMIAKRFDFCASHQLEGLPEGHQCGRLHGHNYQLQIMLQSATLDKVGFIVDYGDMDRIKKYLDNVVEHRHLNDIVTFNPTAENLARHFYTVFKEWYPQIVAVKVKETDKTEASYMETLDVFEDLKKRLEEIVALMEEDTKA